MKATKMMDNAATGSRERGATAARLVEHGRRVGKNAESLGDSVEGLLSEAEAFVRGGLERNPYVTLGAAAGVGFVVAGGLGGRLIVSIALLSGRALAAAALQGAVTRAFVPSGDFVAEPSGSDEKENE